MITHWIVLTLVWKSFSIVGRATLIAEKSLAMTTTLIPIASSASQVVREIEPESGSIAAAYAEAWTCANLVRE